MATAQTDIDDDEPLTLEEACKIIFRNTIRPATLRAEAERGHLVIEQIGRRHYVTRAAIKEMRRLCQLAPNPKDQGSGLSRSGRGKGDRQPHQPGPSETTVDSSVAFRSALTTVAALRKPSKATSLKSTRSLPANVVQLRD